MFTPALLLAHADRQLIGQPDEADIRRSISSMYYALFNALTQDAAALLVNSGDLRARAAIRRTFDHRGVRRACDGLVNAGPARPKLLNELLPASIPPELIRVALAFGELQTSRLQADYDLEATVPASSAKGCQALVHAALADWSSIRNTPAAHAFLLSVAFSERAARRG